MCVCVCLIDGRGDNAVLQTVYSSKPTAVHEMALSKIESKATTLRDEQFFEGHRKLTDVVIVYKTSPKFTPLVVIVQRT